LGRFVEGQPYDRPVIAVEHVLLDPNLNFGLDVCTSISVESECDWG